MLVMLLGTEASSAGQDPLVAAAQKRQSQVRSVDIKFHVKEFVAKGSYTAVAANTQGPRGKPEGAIPGQDTTLESDNRLVIDGSKVRFENNHPMWQLPDGILTQKQRISVTNGELSKVFHPAGVGVGSEMQGTILRDARTQGVITYLTTPLLMHFRGADPSLASYPVQGLKKAGGSLPIAGVRCEDYQYHQSKDSIVELWYDPAGYDLKRMRTLRRGVAAEQTEVVYQPVPGLDSAPKSWVRTEYDASGKVRKVATVTITGIRMNPELKDEEFEITFPPGCRVDDQRVRKEYRVQPSGEMRELDVYGNEIGGDISQPGTPWWSRNKWLLVSAGVVILVSIALLFRRWARRSGSEILPRAAHPGPASP